MEANIYDWIQSMRSELDALEELEEEASNEIEELSNEKDEREEVAKELFEGLGVLLENWPLLGWIRIGELTLQELYDKYDGGYPWL